MIMKCEQQSLNTVCFESGPVKIILYKEWSYKGKDGSNNKIWAHFLHFLLHFKEVYIEKEGVGNFLLWMQKELLHCQCAENLLERQYFRLTAAKVCLVSYKKDYIHYKISGWHFQNRGFMTWKRKEQEQ